jgi:hypothetical protein
VPRPIRLVALWIFGLTQFPGLRLASISLEKLPHCGVRWRQSREGLKNGIFLQECAAMQRRLGAMVPDLSGPEAAHPIVRSGPVADVACQP